MNNTYLSEAFVRLKGVAIHRSLSVLLRTKGHIETTSPVNTPEKQYEFYPYRIVCYHPQVEVMVNNLLKKGGLRRLNLK